MFNARLITLAALLAAGCSHGGAAGISAPPPAMRGPLSLVETLARSVRQRDPRAFVALFSPQCHASCVGIRPFPLKKRAPSSLQAVIWTPALKQGDLVQDLGRLLFSYEKLDRLDLITESLGVATLRASAVLRLHLEGVDTAGRRRTDQGVIRLSLRRDNGRWRVHGFELFMLHSAWRGSKVLVGRELDASVSRKAPGPVAMAWPGALSDPGPWATLDVDGDGDNDLVTAAGDEVLVFHADQGDYDGPHTLLKLPGGARIRVRSLAAADRDGDGRVDLFVGCSGGGSGLWLNRAGGFERQRGITIPGEVVAAAWADLDGTGGPDLYLVRSQVEGLKSRDLLLLAAGLTSAPPAVGLGRGVCAADLNMDGATDLVVVNEGEAPRLWLNLGERGTRFAEAGQRLGLSAAEGAASCTVADLDGDGRLDLFLGGRRPAQGYLFHRSGANAPGQGLIPNRARKERLFRFARGDTIWFSRKGSGGRLKLEAHPLPGPRWTAGAGAMDLDGDGLTDLLLREMRPDKTVEARWWWEVLGPVLRGKVARPLLKVPAPGSRVLLLSNLGRQGKVWLESGYAARFPAGRRAMAVVEPGSQGRPGLLLEQEDGSLRVESLACAEQGARLLLRLKSKGANRDAVGSLVILSGVGKSQVRQVVGASGLPGGPPGYVHFGMGEALRAPEVRVRWPSGRWQRFVDLPADRLVELNEGGGARWSDADTETETSTGPESPAGGEIPEPPPAAPPLGDATTLVLIHGKHSALQPRAAALCREVLEYLDPSGPIKAARLGPGKLPGCTLPQAEPTSQTEQVRRRYKVLLPVLVLLDMAGRVVKVVAGGLGPEHL